MDSGRRSSIQSEERLYIGCHSALEVVACICVIAQRNELVAIYRLQFFQGQMSKRTVLTTLSSHLLEHNPLFGLEQEVGDGDIHLI